MLKKIICWLITRLRFVNKVKIAQTATVSITSSFEGMSQIFPHVKFHGKLGFGSYIGSNCSLSADIGRFTSIANHVSCNPGIHPYKEPFVTTSPCFYSLNRSHLQCGSTFASIQLFEEYVYFDSNNKVAIKIGNDCWIGEGVFIVGGVQIYDGAVVFAHAVVTKDVPPYAIVAGIPAKIIGYRYDKETIDFLLRVKWWNNSKEWFVRNWKLLSDISLLKKYYNNEKSNCKATTTTT